jgi:hypothetical protein
VLGDVGQPQLVGGRRAELALDKVFAGRGILEVLEPFLGPRKALEAQLPHDPRDELGVDDEALFDLQGGLDPQDAIGAPGAGVNVSDGVGEEETSDLAVVGLAELDVVIGRSIETGDLTGVALGVAQVVQPSDNLELAFGSAVPSSKRALAALTALSSASSSLTLRRAANSGSAS